MSQVETSSAPAKRRADPDIEPAPTGSPPPELAPLKRRCSAPAERPIFCSSAPATVNAIDYSAAGGRHRTAAGAATVRQAPPRPLARPAEGRSWTYPQNDWPLLLALDARQAQNRAGLGHLTGKTRYEVNDFIHRLRKSGALVPARGLPRLDPHNALLQQELRHIRAMLHPSLAAMWLPAPKPTLAIPVPLSQPRRALPVMDGFLASRGMPLKDAGMPDRALEFLAIHGRSAQLLGDAPAPTTAAALIQALERVPGEPHLVLCLSSHPGYLEVWRDPGGVWLTQPLLSAAGRLPPAILFLVMLRFFESLSRAPCAAPHPVRILALQD